MAVNLLRFGALALAASLLAAAGPGQTATAPLPIPAQGAFTVDFDNPSQTPDPKLTYKVAFEVTEPAKEVGELNPGLVRVARYLNTLAKYGVPKDHRRLAIVIYGGATEAITSAQVFGTRNGGAPNPNLKLIDDLQASGVELYVCGQAMKAHKLMPLDLAPHVQATISATVTLLNLQAQGYARTR